jgi:hypothetical protein
MEGIGEKVIPSKGPNAARLEPARRPCGDETSSFRPTVVPGMTWISEKFAFPDWA